jgi:glycosyltransferase involved in cell wall biosynthesis
MNRPDNDIFFAVIGGVGNQAYFDEIKGLSAELGLDGRLFFFDYKESIAEYYAAFDIFVNASRDEPFARVNLEAMAMGLPVVATDVGGNPEAVADGEAGYIVNSVAIMAKKILLLADDKKLRETIGKTARKRAKEKFSIDECSSQIVTVIKKVNHGRVNETV